MAAHVDLEDEMSSEEEYPSFFPSEGILPYQFEPEYFASEEEYAGDVG